MYQEEVGASLQKEAQGLTAAHDREHSYHCK